MDHGEALAPAHAHNINALGPARKSYGLAVARRSLVIRHHSRGSRPGTNLGPSARHTPVFSAARGRARCAQLTLR